MIAPPPSPVAAARGIAVAAQVLAHALVVEPRGFAAAVGDVKGGDA